MGEFESTDEYNRAYSTAATAVDERHVQAKKFLDRDSIDIAGEYEARYRGMCDDVNTSRYSSVSDYSFNTNSPEIAKLNTKNIHLDKSKAFNFVNPLDTPSPLKSKTNKKKSKANDSNSKAAFDITNTCDTPSPLKTKKKKSNYGNSKAAFDIVNPLDTPSPSPLKSKTNNKNSKANDSNSKAAFDITNTCDTPSPLKTQKKKSNYGNS